MIPATRRLRTGVILCGTGTAGAYHAGVLKALTEAGIKIDVLAAHGAGVMTALVGGDRRRREGLGSGRPVDGATARQARVPLARRSSIRRARSRRARPVCCCRRTRARRCGACCYAASLAAALVSLTGLSGEPRRRVQAFDRMAVRSADPADDPSARVAAGRAGHCDRARWWPRSRPRATERSRRRWQRRLLVAARRRAAGRAEPAGTLVEALWALVRGASNEPRPAAREIGRRYVDVLTDNFGQPGFHEVIVAVHDLDGRRDLVGAVLAAPASSGVRGAPAPSTARAKRRSWISPDRSASWS